MRRLFLITLIGFITSYCAAQETIAKISKNYFRSDPFAGEFSSFISHLLNDPDLTNKITLKKTDTSFFYFEGTYIKYNPFFFKPKRLVVALTEMAIETDSLKNDTVYTYQLLAYNDATVKGTEEVKKEFEKIFKRFRNSFANNKYAENPAESQLAGATYNFFDSWHALAPFALSWFGPDSKNNEICLVLTVRMQTYMNLAVLPVPFLGM